MAFTPDHLTAIREAIAGGVLSFRYPDGRQVTYQSLDDLLKAEQRISDAIAGSSPGAPRRRRRTPGYRNGC
jgi:hypothetical protein